MRDGVGAGDAALDCGGVTDVRLDEFSRAGPAFGPVAGEADDVVALAEQSGGEASAEYTAGPGDRDPH